MEKHKKTGCKIDMIAEILNPMLRGWIISGNSILQL